MTRKTEDNEMGVEKLRRDASTGPEATQFPENIAEPTPEDFEAWELIDPEVGRYMPRRIRGSFRGRALG